MQRIALSRDYVSRGLRSLRMPTYASFIRKFVYGLRLAIYIEENRGFIRAVLSSDISRPVYR